ncbi:MAG: aminotransferase class V-fold PLP-dependent enzyme, partial [Bacteroidales bacterium]|nr:aminotransferase class V-fold PLP-dependent enzyme [Bacteroidales bacterium]
HRFPELGGKGLHGIGEYPVIYCSDETHHSIAKGARLAGLGSDSVRSIEMDHQLKMKPDQLQEEILKDRQAGRVPVMVVATAGTTGTGTIDNLERIGQICQERDIWYHVDAAYGGACAVNPNFRNWISGIEMSQSLIIDLHKWFSVPMATSMFITSDPDILHRTFGINTGYMPKDAEALQITDPFTHSFQWSRRFSGLKIYLSLLMYGIEGYSEMIARQVGVAHALRQELVAHGWSITNETPLPVVCFTDQDFADDSGFARTICDAVVKSGMAWISVYPIKNMEMLRACITNYNTSELHIGGLVEILGDQRERFNRRIGSFRKQ